MKNRKFYTCSFFGHRKINITKELVDNLKALIINLIDNNVNYFYFGGLSEFDDLCYKIVSELKLKYPMIKRIYALQDPRWERFNKRPAWLKNEEYEELVYLPLDYDYWYTRIYYRNCEIINRSDYCIFYIRKKENSGAYKAYQYAKKQKKKIFEM